MTRRLAPLVAILLAGVSAAASDESILRNAHLYDRPECKRAYECAPGHRPARGCTHKLGREDEVDASAPATPMNLKPAPAEDLSCCGAPPVTCSGPSARAASSTRVEEVTERERAESPGAAAS